MNTPRLTEAKKAFGARAKELRFAIVAADLTDADQQQQLDFDEALPDGAVVLSRYIDVTAVFDDNAAGTVTMDLGIKDGDTDALLDAADCTTAIAKVNGPIGVAPGGHYGGETPTVIVDGSVNLDLIVNGAAELVIVYLTPQG